MRNVNASYHDYVMASQLGEMMLGHTETDFRYTFANFFHPFVGQLISRLNTKGLTGMLDPEFQDKLEQNTTYNPDINNATATNFFYKNFGYNQPSDQESKDVSVQGFPKKIDVSQCEAYANYNWELCFHIPLSIAVHLSQNQRFEEALRWFHFIIDLTFTGPSNGLQQPFWRFLAFRDPTKNPMTIDQIVAQLSQPQPDQSGTNSCGQNGILAGYHAILDNPFQPHAVARTRPLAYQYSVVMKYLDNLIAWGDYLFQQDTRETVTEAIQIYVLAANFLGERPQQIPPAGTVEAKTYAQLKAKLGPIGDAFVELEGQFPFDLNTSNPDSSGQTSSPFGIGKTLYFCIPPNDKLLGYWDTVADRLFKIRHCMNIEGVVRPLALFDPPIDPGLLVKAAAAGIDIGSIVSGLNQPVGPERSLLLIQQALELCVEVKSLGLNLLSALEKGDAEHLALVRQRHEIQLQQMAQEVRFLQWKSAQEATTSLLTSRQTALERLHYYQRLLGLSADQNAPDKITLDRRELTEENFDDAHSSLVGQYDKMLTLQNLPALKLAGDSSPGILSGYSGSGKLYLNHNEDVVLNTHLPAARDLHLAASAANIIASGVNNVPTLNIDLHYWGIGAHTKVGGGDTLTSFAKITGEIAQIGATWEQDQAGMASQFASYERRADEWIFQYNLAAHELMQTGRQILTSLIAEQIAYHDYLSTKQQIKNAQEEEEFLHDKFTNEDLYLWMQGESSRLYYEYYRFAFDRARRAEKTMKQELMRPELDAKDFIKFNYWDGGRKGLLSGEALYLDLKQMEMAYHDSNKRELELTKHVSIRQLDPLALLTLKTTGTCQVAIPEWLYDLDGPGHYMRRIKSVALSIPSVAGPYTSVSCTLSLLNSRVRTSSDASKAADYPWKGPDDPNFVNYAGAIQSIVTSSAQNDFGLFETNLHDERFLPFEGAGAVSTWQFELPNPDEYPAFDYGTITDVILHVRYTARQGVIRSVVTDYLDKNLFTTDGQNLPLLFSLRHDFPNEWSQFVNGSADFNATIRKDYFPYFVQGKPITITGMELYDGTHITTHHPVGDAATSTTDLKNNSQFVFTAPADQAGPEQALTRASDKEVFLIIRYSL